MGLHAGMSSASHLFPDTREQDEGRLTEKALIDFDGWRRAKSSDPKEETRRGFQTGPQAAAKTLANRLKINPDRKTSRQASVSSISSNRSDGATSSMGTATGVPRVQIQPDTPASQTASPIATADALPATEVSDEPGAMAEGDQAKDAKDETPTPTDNGRAPVEAGIEAGPGQTDFGEEKKDRIGTDMGTGERGAQADEATDAAREAVEQAPPVPDKHEEKPLPAVPGA